MANAAAEQALKDQLADAFTVTTTRVTINVNDTKITFNAVQNDSAVANDLIHTLVIKTTKEALITALVDEIVATGRA